MLFPGNVNGDQAGTGPCQHCGCFPETDRLGPVVQAQRPPLQAVSYFFLGVAFFPFAGFAAGLSVYSSGWWRLHVLHMSITSLPLLHHCYTRLYQLVCSFASPGSEKRTTIQAQPCRVPYLPLTPCRSTWLALPQSDPEQRSVILSGLSSTCPREHRNPHRNRLSFHQ